MKKVLEHTRTESMPYVYFNAEKGIFKLEGKSVTNDDQLFLSFYNQIIDFLESYKKTIKPITLFCFDMDYLDNRSYGFYFDIFEKIEEIANLSEVTIIWYYSSIEQEEQGSEYFDHFSNLSFKFISK